MQTSKRTTLAAAAAVAAALVVVGLAFPIAPGTDGPPTEAGPVPRTVPGDPPPGRPAPRASPSPMIGGRYPLVGYGADALRACAPRGGGDWDVAVIPVTAASMLYPDQDGHPDGSLQRVVRSLPTRPDLVVITFEVGGQMAGAADFAASPRQSCIVVAGHTAPEIPWIMGPATFSGRGEEEVPHDIVYRGVGHITDRRIDGGNGRSSAIRTICVTNAHFDLFTVAFWNNDLVGLTSDGCGDHNTVTRFVVGPSSGGNAGRGGGMFKGSNNTAVCGLISWGDGLYMEAMRRSPQIGCGHTGPVNITNVVTFNATDAGRIVDSGLAINMRSILSIGGPITGCARDRGVTMFDQSDAVGPASREQVYLGDVRIEAPDGCDWDAVETRWDADPGAHTVFHFSDLATRVPFEGNGVATPHPDPEWRIEPVPLPELRDHVLDVSGASWGLSCGGAWVRRVNDLDDVNKARIRAGRPTAIPWESRAHWEGANGALTFPEGSPCPDRNGNGIPDEAETWLSGSPTGAPDVGALNPSTGRPWILDYLGGR